MDIKNILAKCDHTLLASQSSWKDIKSVLDDGMEFGTASVCIPPHFVKKAKEYVGNKVKICTVIGFPNGYSATETKVFETNKAIADGADEIDMVINIGELKAQNFDFLFDEISSVKNACGDKILKVIIETCLLTKEEKIKMCEIIAAAKADYVKTSTGFASGGATLEDIVLLRKYSPKQIKVKAAGGISSIDDAEKFIEAGADRLGTSRIVKIVKQSNKV